MNICNGKLAAEAKVSCWRFAAGFLTHPWHAGHDPVMQHGLPSHACQGTRRANPGGARPRECERMELQSSKQAPVGGKGGIGGVKSGRKQRGKAGTAASGNPALTRCAFCLFAVSLQLK